MSIKRWTRIQNTDMNQRQNPQFKQTTAKYLAKQKERKQNDKRKMTISNQVKHFKKMNQSLQKNLQQKQQQLQWLKEVRYRYLSSIQKKKEKQDQDKRELQELRMQNTTMRKKSVQNINDAIDKLQRKKSKARKQVIKNLDDSKKRYSEKKALIDQANHSAYQQMRRSRIKGRNHVNKFFRKKNTQLTREYKFLLYEQSQSLMSGVKQIQQLHVKECRYRDKITLKQSKMEKLQSQIQSMKKSSQQIAMNLIKPNRFTTTYNGAKSKVSKTQRTQQTPDQRHTIGLRLFNAESKQFTTQC